MFDLSNYVDRLEKALDAATTLYELPLTAVQAMDLASIFEVHDEDLTKALADLDEKDVCMAAW